VQIGHSLRTFQVVDDLAALQVDTTTRGTQWGTGGMATKLTAARIACAAGCHMAICNSEKPDLISKIMMGEPCGTVFKPLAAKVTDRKRWILSGELPALSCCHARYFIQAVHDKCPQLDRQQQLSPCTTLISEGHHTATLSG
jgi:hypothetical protein